MKECGQLLDFVIEPEKGLETSLGFGFPAVRGICAGQCLCSLKNLDGHNIIDKPRFAAYGSNSGSLLQAKKDEKEVFFGEKFWATSIFERDLLPSRETLKGPAIIEEKGATTVIPPGWSAVIDASGNLILNRRGINEQI